MRRGAANYGTDFAFATAMFIVFFIFISMFRGCIETNREKAVRAELTELELTGESLAFLRTPITYRGERTTFADLLIEYYLLKESGNSAVADRIKDFLEEEVPKFAGRNDDVSAEERIPYLLVRSEGDDKLLELGLKGSEEDTSNAALLPLPSNARHRYLSVYYADGTKYYARSLVKAYE